MIVPIVTDCDERASLDRLDDSDLVGFPYSANQGYSAGVLRQKYPDAPITLTATTFQVWHPRISAAPVPLAGKQPARQWLLSDACDLYAWDITKAMWRQKFTDKD